MSESHKEIGPFQMGKQLVDALGLTGVKGIVSMQITCEAGRMPTVTIVRSITHEQAGAACMALRSWNCELVPTRLATDREVRADGSVGEALPPPFPSLHPREG
jgi:hypothetical protein